MNLHYTGNKYDKGNKNREKTASSIRGAGETGQLCTKQSITFSRHTIKKTQNGLKA